MNDMLSIAILIIQVLIGFNLVLPFVLLIIWSLSKKATRRESSPDSELDFAIIVTAYQHTFMLNSVVDSILKLNYSNYHIYIVADNCEDFNLEFGVSKLTVLRPENVLKSNIKSHRYAVDRFCREHDCITIIDSDNLVHQEYLYQLNLDFLEGYEAVQGLRAPKNLNTPIACLDAARDIYYHFYDGRVLSDIGSSATLSGSGMAFTANLYKMFLDTVDVNGAGFDKVLQAWLVTNGNLIRFNSEAVVFDEKTSKPEQLIQQRSRWLNSWFKFASYGLKIVCTGVKRLNKNQFVFGIVLLRPPLFIFLSFSFVALVINLFTGNYTAVSIWTGCIFIFVFSFYVSLKISAADKRILNSLRNIPTFVYYQFVSLLKARKANELSVSTLHDRESTK